MKDTKQEGCRDLRRVRKGLDTSSESCRSSMVDHDEGMTLEPPRKRHEAQEEALGLPEHLSKLISAKTVRTKEAKDFSNSEIEQWDVMDTLPRKISIIEKEMTKNLTVQKDTEMIHRTVKSGTKISWYLKERQEHSVNSVDDEAYHRADLDDSRRCSQHC